MADMDMSIDDIESTSTSPNPRKRAAPDDDSPVKQPLNLKGTQFMPTPPDTDQSSNASPTCTNQREAREASPAPSSTLSEIEVESGNIVNNATTTSSCAPTASGSTARPPKRRKLTPAEKEQQRLEKEAKQAEKAALKAKRDVEKQAKDEEKQKKKEAREAKQKEKDEEEERKAQEKLKKERSQMRLGVWFQKPATPAKTADNREAPTSTARRKSLSLEPFDAVADQIRVSPSPCGGPGKQKVEQQGGKTPAKPAVSDYQKFFLPFQLKPHCYMPALPAVDDLEEAQKTFDHEIADPSLQEKYDLGLVDSHASLERQFAEETKYSRGQIVLSARQLLDQIQGTSQQPIDLTEDASPANPMAALQSLSRRYVEFDVDVRPPYFGTYTKIRSPRTVSKLRRNPFTRARPDTDYDYDSEAEWEEPEEGDDECNDDEEETESQADVGEMDEFLDDEEDVKAKRKIITGDLVPTSTGLCWENASGRIAMSIECNPSAHGLEDMRIGVLLPDFCGTTIDPFSMSYWDSVSASQPISTIGDASAPFTTSSGSMAPPRAPLQPRSNTNAPLTQSLLGAAEGKKGPITSVTGTQSKSKPKAAPKTLGKEDLDEFKDAVIGSQLGKADLLKGLKARFPKLTNGTIKHALGEHFAQVGASKADKKWMFVTAT